MNLLLSICYLISSYIRTYLGMVKIMLGIFAILLVLTIGVSGSFTTVHLLNANDPWNG